jgi:hypothetical protein
MPSPGWKTLRRRATSSNAAARTSGLTAFPESDPERQHSDADADHGCEDYETDDDDHHLRAEQPNDTPSQRDRRRVVIILTRSTVLHAASIRYATVSARIEMSAVVSPIAGEKT